jgi:hypothetical protein
MRTHINDKLVDYLVIDMRHNSGGHNLLNRSLVHGLIRSDRVNQPGSLNVAHETTAGTSGGGHIADHV